MSLTVDSTGSIFIKISAYPNLSESFAPGRLDIDMGYENGHFLRRENVPFWYILNHFESTFVKSVFFEWILKTSKRI